MKILVIASTYPMKQNVGRGAFVFNFVQECINQGHEVKVIAPNRVSIKRFGRLALDNPYTNNDRAQVIRPDFITYSSFKLGFINFRKWSLKSFVNAVEKAFKQLKFEPELVYGHFINPSGYTALRIAKKLNVKSAIAVGESEIEDLLKVFPIAFYQKIIEQTDRLIAVSSINAAFLKRIALNNIDRKVLIAPNAINTKLFYPSAKNEIRQQLGLPKEKFIVAFTGYFIKRKGVEAVLAAIEDIPNCYGIFLGTGALVPSGEKVLFAGKVTHDQVPMYLSAADVFVLPTLSEGSSNAIAEAMGCGLPIISSNIPEVACQVTPDNAILTKPQAVGELKSAIYKLINNKELNAKMAAASLSIGSQLSIEKRVQSIVDFIK